MCEAVAGMGASASQAGGGSGTGDDGRDLRRRGAMIKSCCEKAKNV